MTVDAFPIEIRHLMMYRQQEQFGERNWSVFQISRSDGFAWDETPEKDTFWYNVIVQENFGLFYDKYPKVNYLKDMPEEIIMLALDRRVEQGWIKYNNDSLGFNWASTPEEKGFWSSIYRGIYTPYYTKYGNPKVVKTRTSPPYIGDIEGFPVEVVELMLQRQFEQTGKRDVSVFEIDRSFGSSDGGFTWDSTPEKNKFWADVIDNHKFDLFFEKYPKSSLIHSYIKTKQNEKEHPGIEVCRPVATITTRERCTTSGISGRRSPTAITSGHLSHKAGSGC